MLVRVFIGVSPLQRQGHGGAVAPAGERAGEPTSSWFFATTCPFASIRLRYVRRGCHPAAGAPPLACAELCRCLVSVQSAAQACNELFIVELLPQLLGRLLFDAKTRRRQRCGVISSGAASMPLLTKPPSVLRACCSSCIGHRTQGALLPCHGLCCTLLPRRAQHGL